MISTKPRARCHGIVWSVTSEIATGYGLSCKQAYNAWLTARTLHQLQFSSPRRAWVPHLARWSDC